MMIEPSVYGWGINDAAYITCRCPIYQCWRDMIKRCHSPKYLVRRPTYIGCQIDERWRSFMAFREWYLEQAPKSGDQLDKDFLGNGKLYSSETCCFVSPGLNNLFIDRGAKRGSWPQGVYYHKQRGKYVTQISHKGKLMHLRRFDTPAEASTVYLKAKAAYVEELLLEFPQPPRLAAAIRCKMTELNRETYPNDYC